MYFKKYETRYGETKILQYAQMMKENKRNDENCNCTIKNKQLIEHTSNAC